MDGGWLESHGGLAMLTDNQPNDFITSMLKRYPKLWAIVNTGDRPFEPTPDGPPGSSLPVRPAKHREAHGFWDAIVEHKGRVWTVNTPYAAVSLHPRNVNQPTNMVNQPPPVALLPLGPKKGPEFGA